MPLFFHDLSSPVAQCNHLLSITFKLHLFVHCNRTIIKRASYYNAINCFFELIILLELVLRLCFSIQESIPCFLEEAGDAFFQGIK